MTDKNKTEMLLPQAGIPESLNVLLHELRGLGLSINLEN